MSSPRDSGRLASLASRFAAFLKGPRVGPVVESTTASLSSLVDLGARLASRVSRSVAVVVTGPPYTPKVRRRAAARGVGPEEAAPDIELQTVPSQQESPSGGPGGEDRALFPSLTSPMQAAFRSFSQRGGGPAPSTTAFQPVPAAGSSSSAAQGPSSTGETAFHDLSADSGSSYPSSPAATLLSFQGAMTGAASAAASVLQQAVAPSPVGYATGGAAMPAVSNAAARGESQPSSGTGGPPAGSTQFQTSPPAPQPGYQASTAVQAPPPPPAGTAGPPAVLSTAAFRSVSTGTRAVAPEASGSAAEKSATSPQPGGPEPQSPPQVAAQPMPNPAAPPPSGFPGQPAQQEQAVSPASPSLSSSALIPSLAAAASTSSAAAYLGVPPPPSAGPSALVLGPASASSRPGGGGPMPPKPTGPSQSLEPGPASQAVTTESALREASQTQPNPPPAPATEEGTPPTIERGPPSDVARSPEEQPAAESVPGLSPAPRAPPIGLEAASSRHAGTEPVALELGPAPPLPGVSAQPSPEQQGTAPASPGGGTTSTVPFSMDWRWSAAIVRMAATQALLSSYLGGTGVSQVPLAPPGVPRAANASSAVQPEPAAPAPPSDIGPSAPPGPTGGPPSTESPRGPEESPTTPPMPQASPAVPEASGSEVLTPFGIVASMQSAFAGSRVAEVLGTSAAAPPSPPPPAARIVPPSAPPPTAGLPSEGYGPRAAPLPAELAGGNAPSAGELELGLRPAPPPSGSVPFPSQSREAESRAAPPAPSAPSVAAVSVPPLPAATRAPVPPQVPSATPAAPTVPSQRARAPVSTGGGVEPAGAPVAVPETPGGLASLSRVEVPPPAPPSPRGPPSPTPMGTTVVFSPAAFESAIRGVRPGVPEAEGARLRVLWKLRRSRDPRLRQRLPQHPLACLAPARAVPW